MQRVKSPGFAQRFPSIQSVVQNTFYVQRHLLSRGSFKSFRSDAFDTWTQAAAAA